MTCYKPAPLLLLLLIAAGCKSERPPPLSVTVGQAQVLARAGARVTAATARGELYVAGTADGDVLLLTPGGRPRTLAAEDKGVKLRHAGGVSALALLKGGRMVSVGGRLALAWDVSSGRHLRDLGGPQGLSAVSASPDDGVAYFATDQGHLLRWDTAKRAAEGVGWFSCGATQIPSGRLRLPVSKRCPYGTHLVSKKGLPVCLYPATGLLLHHGVLVRACRSGNLGWLALAKHKASYLVAGHLRGMASVDRETLLLARQDGKVNLLHLPSKKVTLVQDTGGRPRALAVSGRLLAAALKDRIILWERGVARPLVTVPTPARAIWIGLRPKALLAILRTGELVSLPLTVSPQR